MQHIRIWDNFTRIYHLSQLIMLALLWYSAEQANFELHFSVGFCLIALWITRIIWGFTGSDTSRFKHFIKSPISVLKAWKSNVPAKQHVGHNPIGGYMVMALLMSLGLQLFSGLFSSDDVFSEGPLYASVSDSFSETMHAIHQSNFDLLLILISLHALAGILHLFRGDNVIGAIISGKKQLMTQPEQLIFKSTLLPLTVWLSLSYGIYTWGMAIASY